MNRHEEERLERIRVKNEADKRRKAQLEEKMKQEEEAKRLRNEELQARGKAAAEAALLEVSSDSDHQSKTMVQAVTGITVATLKRLLSHSSLLGVLTEAEVSELARQCGLQKFQAGVVLVKQGEVGDHIFVIVEGEVDILVDGEFQLRLNKAMLLGHKPVLEGLPNEFTVVCGTPTNVLTISKDALDYISHYRAGGLVEDLKKVAAKEKLFQDNFFRRAKS